MKKLVATLIVTLSLVAGFASTADQARATDGGGASTIVCPSYKPYVRVNAFGMAYCSMYP
jgi:hypothetical protein